jgi:hypothetical protein
MSSAAIHCDLCNGIPIVQGVRSGYYHFDLDGRRRLVLTQKEHERILIDDTAEIIVLSIAEDEVKIGVFWK